MRRSSFLCDGADIGGENQIRILIAHEHALFRYGLEKILVLRPRFAVVGQAADGDQALQRVHDLHPDILLFNLSLKNFNGFEVLRRLKQVPSTRAILLVDDVSEQDLVALLQVGVRGVLLKKSTEDHLIECIDAVVSGRIWIGQDAVADLIDRLLVPSESIKPRRDTQSRITSEEMKLIAAVTEGLCNKEIAQRLSISQQTVKRQLSRVFDKTGVSNRLELALYAREKNLLCESTVNIA